MTHFVPVLVQNGSSYIIPMTHFGSSGWCFVTLFWSLLNPFLTPFITVFALFWPLNLNKHDKCGTNYWTQNGSFPGIPGCRDPSFVDKKWPIFGPHFDIHPSLNWVKKRVISLLRARARTRAGARAARARARGNEYWFLRVNREILDSLLEILREPKSPIEDFSIMMRD